MFKDKKELNELKIYLKKLETYFLMSEEDFKKEEDNYYKLLITILDENIEDNFDLICELIYHIPTIIFSLDFEGDVFKTKKAIKYYFKPNLTYINSFKNDTVFHTRILTYFIPEWFRVHISTFDKEFLKELYLNESYYKKVIEHLPVFSYYFESDKELNKFLYDIIIEESNNSKVI